MERIDTLKTINVLTAALLILFLIFGAPWLLWLALLFTVGNVLESRLTAGIARGWLKFSTVLGNVNTKILLTIIFFCVLTPIAFLFRLFNRDLVDHFRANRRASTFDDLNKSYPKSDFEKLW